MPNDAKLGLVVGVAGVLLAAVVYGPRNDPRAGGNAAAVPARPPAVATAPPPRAVVAAAPAAPLPPAAGPRPEPVGQVTSGRKPKAD